MDDWQPGDIALCVNDDWRHPGNTCHPVHVALAPRRGTLWEVAYVERRLPFRPLLGLEGQPSNILFSADKFRKIRPEDDADIERIAELELED